MVGVEGKNRNKLGACQLSLREERVRVLEVGRGEVMMDQRNAVVVILFTNWLGCQQDETVQLLAGLLFHINQPQLENWSIPYNFHFNI